MWCGNCLEPGGIKVSWCTEGKRRTRFTHGVLDLFALLLLLFWPGLSAYPYGIFLGSSKCSEDSIKSTVITSMFLRTVRDPLHRVGPKEAFGARQ